MFPIDTTNYYKTITKIKYQKVEPFLSCEITLESRCAIFIGTEIITEKTAIQHDQDEEKRQQQRQQQQQREQEDQEQQQQVMQMGSKRNRVLTRQPRVKRDSDSLSSHVSPEPPSITSVPTTEINVFRRGSGDGEYGEIRASEEANDSSSGTVNVNQTRTLFVSTQGHHRQHHLLTVPPRIERHSSEPAPSISPSSPNLLTVPQNSPFLIKQHSDPLPPTHHQYATTSHLSFGIGISDSSRRNLSGAVVNAGTLTNPFAPLHRQYSHPLASVAAAATYAATTAPLQPTQHISLPEAIYANTSPPPVGSTQYIVPVQTIHSTHSGITATVGSGISINSLTSSTTTTTTTTTTKIPYVTVSEEYSASTNITNTISSATIIKSGSSSNSSNTLNLKANNNLKYRFGRSLQTATAAATHTSLSSSSSSTTSGIQTSGGSSSFEFTPLLRVRNEELQRSVSSPQTSREMITLENPRSSHCPVIRPGPALGCNYCWNTIDSHGRILRRKTKYHCPECQTNLCIVPCFQEYHERLNNETTPRTNNTTKPSSSTSMHFGNNQTDNRTTRQQYTKTESI